MREIKFRAKRIDSGEWVYGYLYKCDKFARIITAFAYTNEDGENESLGQYYCEAYDVDINTLSQFTGLYDKNGKEIYEGDIVKLESGFFEGIYNVVKIEENECYCVYYDNKNARYDLKTQDDNLEFKRIAWAQLVEEKVEIMGNCYDNQELLKGE